MSESTVTGRGVKNLRQALGLTHQQLGDVLGVSQATVYRWEAAGRKLRLRPLHRSVLLDTNVWLMARNAGAARSLGFDLRVALAHGDPSRALKLLLDRVS